MSECRKPGSLGVSRKGPNSAPVSTPLSTTNSGGAAPGGEIAKPDTRGPIKAGDRKTAR